jgi:hypothetical protein
MVKQLRRSVDEYRRTARTQVRSLERRLIRFERDARRTFERLPARVRGAVDEQIASLAEVAEAARKLSLPRLARAEDVRRLSERVEALHKKIDRLAKTLPKAAA